MAQSAIVLQRVEDLIKCAICLEEFVNPKSLPCLHTFCLDCIKGHCRGKSPGGKSDCPTCRRVFEIPRLGVEQLESNFWMNDLIEAKQASDETTEMVQCDECSNGVKMNPSAIPLGATLYCTLCARKLCNRCSKLHQETAGRAHQVVPFDINITGTLFTLYCNVHPRDKLEKYCTNCHTNVCKTCHDKMYKNHNCQDINDIYKEFKDTLSRDFEQVTAKGELIENELSRLDISQRLHLEKVRGLEQSLSCNAVELKRKVDHRAGQLIQVLSDNSQSLEVASALKNDLTLALAASQSLTKCSRDLLKFGKPGGITQAYHDLHERANDFIKAELKSCNWCFPDVDISLDDLLDEVAKIVLQKSTHGTEHQNVSKLAQLRTRKAESCNNTVVGMTKKCIGKRTILEYKNTSVLLSHILPDLQAWRRAYNDVTEIRIICTDRLSIDCDLVNSDWHGINIAIVANVIEVMCNCIIDVSGLKAPDHTVPAASATDPGEDGEPGEHGIAGESGGNVLLCCSTLSGKQLRIKSNGGNGGEGQDGGDGMDGRDGTKQGESLTADEFKERFPTMSWLIQDNLLKTLKNVDNNDNFIVNACYSFNGRTLRTASGLISAVETAMHWFSNHVFMDSQLHNGKHLTVSFYNTWNPRYVKHCYVLYKGGQGEHGQRGGRGGKGGRGGARGYCGWPLVLSLDGKDLKVPNVEITNQNGNDGQPGIDGTGGKRGKDGCKGEDHGYISRFYTGSTTHYKGNNLEIQYSDTSSSDSVWCQEKRSFVSIVDIWPSPSTVPDFNDEKVPNHQIPAQTVAKESLTFAQIRHDAHVVLMDAKQAIKHTETVKLIHSLDEQEPIVCLTTLNNELFVSYQSKTSSIVSNAALHDSNTYITVYDTETFCLQRYIRLPGIVGVKDMASCDRNQCIYISDPVNRLIHRVDNENEITQWSVDDLPEGLSVTYVFHVLVTCKNEGKVKEFTTDGKLIRVINLQSDVVHPFHTVELIRDQFVVCHGYGNDPLHRVCLVDSSGRVLKSFGGSLGSGTGKLNTPVRLAVSGFIFVADCINHRVRMLSPELSLLREVTSGVSLSGPMRIWLDSRTSLLYIADNKLDKGTWISGQVKVYSIV